MYSDEDLSQAVKAGIFEASAVEEFRDSISSQTDTNLVDEENFRLISGFNDIFVSISAYLLIMSAGWLSWNISPVLGLVVAALLSWFLSVFFVQKKRLALPAIILLISFVASSVTLLMILFSAFSKNAGMTFPLALGFGVVAAWIHWRKFHVPITVAAGMASFIGCLLMLVYQVPPLKDTINVFIGGCGVLTFLLAMGWDARDTTRTTRKSDVAFWLHLLSAPLIVHPVFAALGVLQGNGSLFSVVAVVLMFVFLAFLSIAVDRRAFMVSALVYVLIAFRDLFKAYDMVDSGLAVSGVFIGSMLLLLSAFWHKSRAILLRSLPAGCLRYVPPIN